MGLQRQVSACSAVSLICAVRAACLAGSPPCEEGSWARRSSLPPRTHDTQKLDWYTICQLRKRMKVIFLPIISLLRRFTLRALDRPGRLRAPLILRLVRPSAG